MYCANTPFIQFNICLLIFHSSVSPSALACLRFGRRTTGVLLIITMTECWAERNREFYLLGYANSNLLSGHKRNVAGGPQWPPACGSRTPRTSRAPAAAKPVSFGRRLVDLPTSRAATPLSLLCSVHPAVLTLSFPICSDIRPQKRIGHNPVHTARRFAPKSLSINLLSNQKPIQLAINWRFHRSEILQSMKTI